MCGSVGTTSWRRVVAGLCYQAEAAAAIRLLQRLRNGGDVSVNVDKRVFIFVLLGTLSALAWADEPSVNPTSLVARAVRQLVPLQETDGDWPYEGVYRVRGKIPIGYRIGGTALVSQALLYGAPPADKKVTAALERGLDFLFVALADSRMAPSTRDVYDVRVWGQSCALEYLCRLRDAKRWFDRREKVDSWIQKLTAALIEEELSGGGWNYASRRAHAPFVTAPVVQALLWAKAQGETVPDDVLDRARDVLLASRTSGGGFTYSHVLTSGVAPNSRARVPGSIGRAPLCELTLVLLGAGSSDAVAVALNAFHEHWNELEKRRKQHGTHAAPYGIAPYYFYFAHRYAGQAIGFLPKSQQTSQRERLLELLLRTRDDDGTWNDRVFPRSRNFGTAMAVLALLGERIPPPPRFGDERGDWVIGR